MNLTFVVGTGRCGSGLLSRMLHANPEVAAVDQLFYITNSLRHRLTGVMDGGQFWRQIADPAPFMDAMVRDGLMVPELTYPYATGRFKPQTGIPYISHLTLPALTDDPDRLYDRLAAVVPHWPARRAPDHYRRLLSWLAEDLGKPVIVERSCCSIRFVEDLHQAFPEARFVYLSRDGVDCALSMSEHAAYRLPVLARVLLANEPMAYPALGEAATQLAFDADLTMKCDIPPAVFGAMWSAMTRAGAKTLSRMPAEAWTSIRFEQLMFDPAASLRRLARFLGVAAPAGWVSWAKQQARPQPGASATLDPKALAALRAACGPGYDADGALHARQLRKSVA